jgi:hypothetical protein
VVAIDIDEEDRAKADALQKLAEEFLGPKPCVRFGRRPRRVLLYRAIGEIRSKTVKPVDIIAHGKQFVAYSTHPDTQMPYAWRGPQLVDTPIEDLPGVTAEQIGEFLARLKPPAKKKSKRARKPGKPVDRDVLIQHLPPWLQHKIKTAVDEGERSEPQFGVIASLYDQGASMAEIFGIVRAYQDGFAEKLDTDRRAIAEIERIHEKAIKQAPQLVVVGLGEFLKIELPPREMIMAPWLPSQGLAMIFAAQGVGKTNLALQIGVSIAAGKPFLDWQVPEPKRVLYVDGEMPARTMQMRLQPILKAIDAEVDDRFQLVTPDLQIGDLPNVATLAGQQALEPLIADRDVVVVDNLATLCRTSDENASANWVEAIQGWLLKQRKAGRTVILVHHAGKAGTQRGTSARTDVLDSVMKLDRSKGYTPDEGAKFKVSWEKSRGFFGEDARPFELRLDTSSGVAEWSADVDGPELQNVVELSLQGLSVRKIAQQLGRDHSWVQRRIDKARKFGMFKKSA